MCVRGEKEAMRTEQPFLSHVRARLMIFSDEFPATVGKELPRSKLEGCSDGECAKTVNW